MESGAKGTYVRWRKGESRRCRVFAGGVSDNDGWGECLVCGFYLANDASGAGVQLIALFPAEHDRDKFDEGRWSTCHALLLHHSCAEHLSDAELDELAGELHSLPGATEGPTDGED